MSDIEFYPDYHEHDDFGPAMLALSHFVIQWNWAEHNFGVLLWQYSSDFKSGAMYTAGLGNQSRANTLLALARRNEKNLSIRELIEFVVKAFIRINENRNSLVHAHSITFSTDEEKPRWIRASTNPKSIHVYCYANTADIIDNLNAACQLSLLLSELHIFYIGKLNPLPSLGKFPLPKVLTAIPIKDAAPE